MAGLSFRRSSTHGVVAAVGKLTLGGIVADVGGDEAQLTVMVSKTSGASRVQRFFGVMGAPCPGLCAGCGPDKLQGLLLMGFDAGGLTDSALDLKPTRDAVALRRRGARLGRLQSASSPVKRIPAKAKRVDQDDQGGDTRNHRDRHERRPGQRALEAGAHGNALRSSSKCGPSRKVGQSPPQTMAVPCRAAAALKAAAMRG